MSYQVEYQERLGYLSVHVLGERSFAAVVALTKEVFEKANALQFEKLLIDVRELEGWLQTMESYEIVTQEFAKFMGKGIKKVAIVDRDESPQSNRWRFFETIAQNRGFNLRIYTDPDQAASWLVGRQDNESSQ